MLTSFQATMFRMSHSILSQRKGSIRTLSSFARLPLISVGEGFVRDTESTHKGSGKSPPTDRKPTVSNDSFGKFGLIASFIQEVNVGTGSGVHHDGGNNFKRLSCSG